MSKLVLVAWAGILVVGLSASAQAQQFNVMVTNDDGFDAEGIDALVEELRLNPNLDITVIAPLTNQSATGDSFSSTPLPVASSMTLSGFAVTTVDGFPADSVFLGVLELLTTPPDVIVSGINTTQNITEEITEISGTVGAALTAARLGVPAIAVSQGLVATDYSAAARYTANLVEKMRQSKGLRKKLFGKNGLGLAKVINVNVPTCTSGSVRGVELVPLADLSKVTSYSFDPNSQSYTPTVTTGSLFGSDCESTLVDPATDLEAMNNGFASVTVLNPDLTVDSKLKRYGLLRKIDFE